MKTTIRYEVYNEWSYIRSFKTLTEARAFVKERGFNSPSIWKAHGMVSRSGMFLPTGATRMV